MSVERVWVRRRRKKKGGGYPACRGEERIHRKPLSIRVKAKLKGEGAALGPNEKKVRA